jgi:putative two-component system response regulator
MTTSINKKNILAVDDTPINIDLISEVLSEDYTISAAINGQMALKSVERQIPDLILLDIMMPDMDGYELCQKFKSNEKTKAIPIIFVSALGQEKNEAKGFQLGAADYIQKPISPAILKARVATHLALADQRHDLELQVQNRTEELNQSNQLLQRSRKEIILRLGQAAEYRDNETGMHVTRMSIYSQLLAKAAGSTDEEAELILNAAPMHDVGKIGIPDAILLKPGKLTDDEWKIIRNHPNIGAELLGNSNNKLMDYAYNAALTHHEKWDGSGYPKGLKGNDIPYIGRVVAIADVFDALNTKRPYKKAWPHEDVIMELKKGRGTHFDPILLDHFLRIMTQLLEVKEKYIEIG